MLKYVEIADVIRERIENQTYPTGSFLPNQVDLVTEFQVSRMTIKKAINILIMEGLVLSKRGSGTKVLDHSFWGKETSPMDQYQGLTYQMKQRGRTITSQIIRFEVVLPEKRVQKMLKLADGAKVYEIIRLRLLDEQPYVLEHSFMPLSLVPNLKEEHLLASIYDYLLDELGLRFAGMSRTIQADKSHELDQMYLDCGVHDPILEVEQVVYLENGVPVDYSTSHNRYDTRGYSMLDLKNMNLD